jgi:hypothetical protein
MTWAGAMALGSAAVLDMAWPAAHADRIHVALLGVVGHEAMHGTLRPEQTPGGGLTMIISMPARATALGGWSEAIRGDGAGPGAVRVVDRPGTTR